MAFLGSIGKFIGTAAKVAAPLVSLGTSVALSKIAPGGGGFLGSVGKLTSFLPGAGGGPSLSGSNIFSGIQTAFAQPAARFPSGNGTPMQPIPTMAAVPALTKPVFDIILKLASQLGIVIKSPNAVVRVGRNIVARLLRFARANPGLTIINLLTNIGLTIFEANELITWFTTHGKRHRRIRVTNVKALNRSVRRLEGFRRLSHRVENALARRGVARSISRARRCPRCRKSPCCC